MLVTKDADFVESFIVRREPRKLLLISTGNISNKNLEAILSANLNRLIEGFDTFDFIELNRINVIFHM
ncbi:MAG TPA: DUF5615 family PIN-like protein [Pyrinomonadaceae bacterium]|nr:DUF5615 family PIN-like protein [Pyrinomonadaceae bacterium]